MVPFSMSGHCSLMDRSRMKDFIANIRRAAFFNCQYIVSSIGEAHLADGASASNETVAEHIRTFLPFLEEYGLELVLEVHGEHGSGGILKEIVSLVDSPRVKINYDTANAIFYGDVDVVKDLAGCLDQVDVYKRQELGGQLSGEHGIGNGRLEFLEEFVGPRMIQLYKAIKLAFDDKLILNPGKVIEFNK